MDIITKEFGSRVKSYRRSRKLTQEKFSELIDINLRQLARIEAGESFVSSKTLVNICHTLHITPNDLFDFDINDNGSLDDNDLKELKININKISKDKMKIEYMNLAYRSLFDKKALNDLKIIIKGIELTK